LQHAGFVTMNPDRHLRSHYDFYLHLLRGDDSDADAHRRFYDEYNAVLDMPALFYLETIRTVFQEFRLPRGNWVIDGCRVDPAAISRTALLTIEGELDDISGEGQTHAAHDLCRSLPKSMRESHTAAQCGHYGIFSGRRWREQICPKISAFIRAH
ncbi:MAG TPA: polyhydroxyalkanoate depolymerase, partial [Castellaniella sp.]|nr:polyhydroxyalkanoate depolymerase [Castellaniella sp.]